MDTGTEEDWPEGGEDAGAVSEESDSRPFFRFCPVAGYSFSEKEPLHFEQPFPKPEREGEPLNMGLNWDSLAREKFYNERFSEDFALHDSYSLTKQKKVVELSECLDLFTTKEKLGKDDLWYCPACKEHKQATKKMDLWSLPEFLIVHLKRFSYTRYWRDKIEALVDFPVRGLDLKDYALNKESGSYLYDLIGVSNHYGALGGGHYTAYALNKGDGRWYNFDDSHVSPLDESDNVVTKSAYVLFYKRRAVVTPQVEPNIEAEQMSD